MFDLFSNRDETVVVRIGEGIWVQWKRVMVVIDSTRLAGDEVVRGVLVQIDGADDVFVQGETADALVKKVGDALKAESERLVSAFTARKP